MQDNSMIMIKYIIKKTNNIVWLYWHSRI